MQYYYTEVILLYSRETIIFPSITDHNLLNILVILKLMFPSLAFHGFYITQGNNSLIVPSSCEKHCTREQASDGLFCFGTKQFSGLRFMVVL